jgi:hypothetical protein
MQQQATVIALQTQLAQAQEQLQHWQATHPDLPDPVAAILNPGTSALQPMPRRITWEEVK